MALPRAVLFDWDNTLVDNWGCIRAALNATLTAFGLEPWSVEETRERVKQSLRDSFPGIFGPEWPRAREMFYARFEEHHLDYLRPLGGSAELLETLAARGVYLGVVSNKTGRFLRAESAHLGWDRFFGRLVGAADAPADKPAVDPVRMALEPAGLAPGPAVWFVGDADIDMQCAHAAGCTPILIGVGSVEFEKFPPAHCFENCAMLSRLVEAIGDPISLARTIKRTH